MEMRLSIATVTLWRISSGVGMFNLSQQRGREQGCRGDFYFESRALCLGVRRCATESSSEFSARRHWRIFNSYWPFPVWIPVLRVWAHRVFDVPLCALRLCPLAYVSAYRFSQYVSHLRYPVSTGSICPTSNSRAYSSEYPRASTLSHTHFTSITPSPSIQRSHFPSAL